MPHAATLGGRIWSIRCCIAPMNGLALRDGSVDSTSILSLSLQRAPRATGA
jgi:hypothetical protein